MATSSDDDAASVLAIDPSELDQVRSNVLKCQIATYRLLARNLPVSDALLHSCSYKAQLATLIQSHLEQTSKSNGATSTALTNGSKVEENKRH